MNDLLQDFRKMGLGAKVSPIPIPYGELWGSSGDNRSYEN